MGMLLKPATPLTVTLLAAFALLLLSVLSTPIVKAIPLAKVDGTSFGVLGYCTDSECTPFQVGYDFGNALFMTLPLRPANSFLRGRVEEREQIQSPREHPRLPLVAPRRPLYCRIPCTRVSASCGCRPPALPFALPAISPGSSDPTSPDAARLYAGIFSGHTAFCPSPAMGRVDRSWCDNSSHCRGSHDLCYAQNPCQPQGQKAGHRREC